MDQNTIVIRGRIVATIHDNGVWQEIDNALKCVEVLEALGFPTNPDQIRRQLAPVVRIPQN